MTSDEFKAMVQRPEGAQFDVKAAFPDLTNKKSLASFLKDVLSFSNTPRDTASFILYGIRDVSRDLVGIAPLPDEADIRNRVSANTNPCPHFILHPLAVDGLQVAAIEFPPLPRLSQPSRSFPDNSLALGQIWFRSGSTNQCALGADLERVSRWAKSAGAMSSNDDNALSGWDAFLAAAHGFEEGRSYILLSHPIERDSKVIEVASKLSCVPWAVVLDFDRNSESGGLYSCASAAIEQNQRKVHRATLKSEINFDFRRGCLWYFADGLRGQQMSFGGSTFNEWQKAYRVDIRRLIGKLAKLMMPRPVTLVLLWRSDLLKKHSRVLLDEFSIAMGGNFDALITSEDSQIAKDIVLEEEFSDFTAHVQIDAASLAHGLDATFSSTQATPTRDRTLPAKDGAPLTIPQAKALWLEEELEVVWLEAGKIPPAKPEDPLKHFLTGGEITWFSLAAGHDVSRNLSPQVLRSVTDDLDAHRPNRINLYHGPGGGGSTVARRILFDIHKKYPTTRLRRLSESTFQKIEFLARTTRKAALIMVDGGDLDERELDDLFQTCQVRSIPVVILQVQRRLRPQQQKKRAFYLPGQLDSTDEVEWFADRFSQAVPERRQAIRNLCKPDKAKLHTPFFFGLTSYEKDFLALPEYIEQRLSDLKDKQRELIVFLALSYYYGQRAVPVHSFAAFLGLPESRTVDLNQVFESSPITLDLLLEVDNDMVRIIHTLLAEEILIQVLSGHGERRAWKQKLSDFAIGFANYLAAGSSTISEEMNELAHRVFILRNNSSLLGSESFSSTKFSPLLEDIPTLEGRRRVLEELSEIFPEEPHFLAHLARLYAFQDRDFSQAHNYAERALSLRPQSPTLHHVVGMIWREQAYDDLTADSPTLFETSNNAVDAFKQCREFGDYEYGAIAEAQLRIRVLDKLGEKHPGGVVGLIGAADSDPFVRECYSTIQELLTEIRSKESGETPSTYESDCRARLNNLVKNYEAALDLWNTLLDPGRGVFCPPVRRNLTWTYLQRAEGKWDMLPQKNIDRIFGLMEQNLAEEPNNEKNLRLWMRSVRFATNAPTFDGLVERLSYWHTNNTSLDACYYLAILHSLKAIDGSDYSRLQAKQFWASCEDMAPEGPRGRRSHEWLGRGEGIRRLVHSSSLGEWNQEIEFFENPMLLKRVTGRIADASVPQAGVIDLECGLPCFFVPSRGGFHAMECELLPVNFFLGFSYKGLRAWEVGADQLDDQSVTGISHA